MIIQAIAILCLILFVKVVAGFVFISWFFGGMGGQPLSTSLVSNLPMLFLYGSPPVIVGLTAQILHQRKQGKRLWPYAILLAMTTPVIIWGVLDSLSSL